MTNEYTNMDVEPVNNSPEYVDVGNQVITITNFHNCRRQASVLTPANTNCRSTRCRCCTTNNNDNVLSPANSNYTTPNSNIRSIRYGTRCPSLSTGLRTDEMYNLNYRSQQQSHSETCDGSCMNKYACRLCDKKCICICVDTAIPMHCSNCINEPCEAHVTIKCTNSLCGKLFHTDCVASLEHQTFNQWQQMDTDSFYVIILNIVL